MRSSLATLSTVAAASLFALSSAAPAWANCASGDQYSSRALDGNRVQICPQPNSDVDQNRKCPDPLGTGMLREDLATGEVVQIADRCVSNDAEFGDDKGCYLDECVPPGSYRYGFATPWQNPSCTGCPPSQYFVELSVTEELSADCAPTVGFLAPVAQDTPVPWADDPNMCDERGFGCAFTAQPKTAVLGINAVVALLGLGAMARRRRRDRADRSGRADG